MNTLQLYRKTFKIYAMDFSGWQKLSLVDYDNHIATTLFTAGCNFRCPFCHNSELVLNPKDAITIPWLQIIDYLRRRVGILEGVVITGGEPTLMPDLMQKIQEIKTLGYSIKLDTNGSNPDLLIDLVNLGLIDYVAMDIKNSLEKYKLTAGVNSLDVDKIKESIKFLINGVVDYEFRTTIIDEFHTNRDMEQIGSLIEGAKQYYLQHYIDSENCIKHGYHEVSKEKALIFKAIVGRFVKEVDLRGYE